MKQANLIDTDAIAKLGTPNNLNLEKAKALAKASNSGLDVERYVAAAQLGDQLSALKTGFLSVGNHLTLQHVERMMEHILQVADKPGDPEHDMKVIKLAPGLAQLALARAAIVREEMQLLEVAGKKTINETHQTLAPQLSIDTAYIQVQHPPEKVDEKAASDENSDV